MTGDRGRGIQQVRGSVGRMASRSSRLVLLLGVVPLLLTLTRWGAPKASEGPNPLRIASAADFSRLAPLAPESLATAFGKGLAMRTVAAEGHPLPTTLGGTTVRVCGVLAPLTYVSPEQVNFQVPAGLPAGEATITITAGDGTVSEGVTRLAPVSPGLFAADFLIDQREDGDQVYLVLFGTGIRGRGKPEDVTVIIGGVFLPVVYADDQQGYAGLDQINVRLPESMIDQNRLEVAVSIQTDGPDGLIVSNSLTIEAGASPDLNVTAPWQSIILSRRPTRPTPSNALRLVRKPEITGLPLESVTAGSAMFVHGVNFAPEARGNLAWIGDVEALVERGTSTQLLVRIPYGSASTSVRVKTSQGEATSGSASVKIRTSLSGLVLNTEKKPIANLPVELLRPSNNHPVMTVTTGPNGVFIFSEGPDGPGGSELGVGDYLIRFNGGESAPPLPYPRLTSRIITVDSSKDVHYRVSTLQEISQGAGASRDLSSTTPPISLEEQGISFQLPANTTVNFPNGTTSQRLTLSRVKESIAPNALPLGWLSREVAQLTPIGATFSPGGKLIFPNEGGYPLEEVLDLYRLEQKLESPNVGQFIKVGTANVTSGGKIETEPNAIQEASVYLVSKSPPPRTVKGTVVMQGDNRPVSQAQVRAGGQQTLTDKDGKFELSEIQTGSNNPLTVEAILVRADGAIAWDRVTGVQPGPDGTLPNPLALKIEWNGTAAKRVTPGVMPLNFKTASVDAEGSVTRADGKPMQQYVEELEEGINLEMVKIPGGSFTMGSPDEEVGRFLDEGPRFQVSIPGFMMGKYEVTQRIWKAVAAMPKVELELNADPVSDRLSKGENRPIVQVSWEEAKEFIARLNKRLGLTGKYGYRLPSEAEWEYAARAGTTTPFAFGAKIKTDIANYNPGPIGATSRELYRGGTVDVGTLGVANAWGLFDVHGNVWEMCEDDWHDSYRGAPVDGSAWAGSVRALTRVMRGGSWSSNAVDCRSAYRSRSPLSNRLDTKGFRLARTLPTDTPVPNRKPQITVPGDQNARVGLRLSFTVSAADLDPGQTLELTATPLPAGATFTPSGRSGAFTWTPAPDQEGSYTITFQATDNGTPALSETKTVMITVVNPEIVWMPLNFTTASVDAAGSVTRADGTPKRKYDQDLVGGVKLEMVEVPGGSFTMGSPASEVGRGSQEGPPRVVNVNGFVMGKYEVTQAQWRAVMGTNPSRFTGDNLPVEEVSWDDAQEFCRRLNARLGLSGSTGYRLPSEAEWEYAARAGTATPFAFGVTINAEIINYSGLDPYGNAPVGIYRGKTVNVGSLGVANGWGLYDMHGNVQELCEDDWHDNYTGAPVNGNAWVETSRGEFRLLRGGGFDDGAVYCRSAYRGRVATGFRNKDIGFRLARTLPENRP